MKIFKKEKYETNLDPVLEYIKQNTKLLSKRFNIEEDKARNIVKEILKESEIKNPIVTYRNRKENGDTETVERPLTKYIKDTIKDNEVIVPSFTTYIHPDKQTSLHAKFLNINIVKRKKDKANMFKYKQLGDMDKFTYYNTLQKVRKIFNNSLSGAYASKSTILHNPSAHYTLTSMTRSVASIGNAITESFVSGNKLFMTPEIVMGYISSVITEVNKKAILDIVNIFGIHLPTAEEVMDMILYSTRLYWRDESKEAVILETLKTLDKYELAGIMYINDLHHLKKYNESFVKTMLGELSKKVTSMDGDPYKAITSCTDSVRNLVHHICASDLKGVKVDYAEFKGTDKLMLLGATANNVVKTFRKYRLLIRAFYVTNILPVNIANMKDTVRDSIVLSDTDSTCGSYDTWVQWYFGNLRYSEQSIALAGAVMTINSEIMDHQLKIFSKNMNIADELNHLLAMKNEFFWSVFITANVSKHYFANIGIQEGNVYAEPDLELKGVHLIASAGSQDVVTVAHNMAKDIMATIESGKQLDVVKYIEIVIEAENNLMKLVKEGNINIFKREKIKDPSSYKDKNKNRTPYFYHTFWKEVFSDDYGYPGEPQYMVLKIPTKFATKRIMNDYLDNMDDKMLADKFRNTVKKYGKDKIGIVKVPVAIASGRGIPKEILKMIDVKKLVTDSLNVFYIVLETLGVYRKPNLMISEMNIINKG